MGFLRQEYWSELPFPSLEDLPDPGIEPASPALAGGFFAEPPRKAQEYWSEESKKAGLNSSFKKIRSCHPVPSLHGKYTGKQW